jgi:HAD superfamily hydrolase (TIGR01548 family)
MKKNYDALIFDMDGVLVDVSQSYRKTIKKTAEFFLSREVKSSEINEIKEKVGMNNDWDATYALINNKSYSYGEVKEVFQKLYLGDSKTKGFINNETLLITKDKFSQLKNIYKKMGIATGRPKVEAQYVIDRFNLKDVFNVVIAKEDVKKEKPFPDPILRVMSELKIKKGVYIGDSPSDVVAATAAGIPSIYIGDQNIGTVRFKLPINAIDYLL